MAVKEFKDINEFQEVINSGTPIVVDFWATWCGPCRMISPKFEEESKLAKNATIEFYKVDVDKQQDISQRVGVRAMPTFVYFLNGVKEDEVVGAVLPKLLQLVAKAASV